MQMKLNGIHAAVRHNMARLYDDTRVFPLGCVNTVLNQIMQDLS